MFLEVCSIFTLLTVLNLWFVAFLRNAIRSHASRLVLATDALRQEENSCLQLCLHPSPVLNGDADAQADRGEQLGDVGQRAAAERAHAQPARHAKPGPDGVLRKWEHQAVLHHREGGAGVAKAAPAIGPQIPRRAQEKICSA